MNGPINELAPRWGEASRFHDPYILANFQARDSDVLITTAPKAGTTWMQQILHQLRTGGDETFECIDDVVPWLELPRPHKSWQDRLQTFANMPDPRIFKTHCTAEQTPGIDVARIILSSRDPRDCCVSFFHHRQALTIEAVKEYGAPEPKSFNEFFEDWLAFGAWYRNIQSWWPLREKENVLWLRYEDMRDDLVTALDQILHFLQWQIDANQIARVLHYCSFAWMKENSHRFDRMSEHQKSLFKPGEFIRKGEIGDHKNLLSAEQENRILEKAVETLEDECLQFLGLEASR